jgi:hypothetical protein
MRLQRLLESVVLYDLQAFRSAQWLVVEDPSDKPATDRYRSVLRNFSSVEFTKLGSWSNMHGSAMAAFEIAQAEYKPEWIVYLGDDVMVTRGALSTLFYFIERNALRTVSLVQPAYWNAHELFEEVAHAERRGPGLLRAKEDMYTKDPAWLLEVPRNPHWDGEGFARPYVNVNGCGFACRADHYFRVGGFAEGTWCLDETLSVRTWLGSDQSIVCLPGPPLVHYFGAATECNPPAHDLYTAERWAEAMGMTKEVANKLSYEKMFEREAAVLAETRSAAYL